MVMADGFESGTRSAAAGGNTTVMPFALQQKGQSLREAVQAILSNQAVNPDQKPSMGCNIKWKPGNTPDDS